MKKYQQGHISCDGPGDEDPLTWREQLVLATILLTIALVIGVLIGSFI